MPWPPRTLVLPLLLCGLFPATAHATLFVPTSSREMAMTADAIVIGTVMDVRPHQPGGLPGLWTDIEVRVDIPLKRTQPGDVIILTMPGGRQGDVWEYVHGTPEFRIGEQALLYIEQSPLGHLQVKGWVNGKWGVQNRYYMESIQPFRDVVSEIAQVCGEHPASRQTGPDAALSPSARMLRELLRDPAPLGSDTPQAALSPEGATKYVELLREDFEGAWPTPLWRHHSTDYRWAARSEGRKYGTKSLYCVGGGTKAVAPPGPHPNGAHSEITCGPFDLRDAEDVFLDFSAWFDTKWAFLEYGASPYWHGGGGPYQRFSSATKRWFSSVEMPKVDFSSLLGERQVWLRFRFDAGAYDEEPHEGVYLDDIILRKRVRLPKILAVTPPAAPANTNGPASLIRVTGNAFFPGAAGKVKFPRLNQTTRLIEYRDASIRSWSDSTIECYVPTADSGRIRIVTAPGMKSAPWTFNVPFCYTGAVVPDDRLPSNRTYGHAGTPDAEDEFRRLDAAFGTWQSVSGTYAYCIGGGIAPQGMIRWCESDWSYGAQTPAVTKTTVSGGRIIEHEILFNGEHFQWSDGSSGGGMDIQAVATHEVGHWWGLDDLYGDADRPKTMHGEINPGETGKRTLAPGDEQGIQWLYPGKPGISVSPASLTFTKKAGDPDPPRQIVQVRNTGSGHLTWAAKSPQSWLHAEPFEGDFTRMNVEVRTQCLGAGGSPYKGYLLLVGPPGSAGGSSRVNVTLEVTGDPTTLEWADGFGGDGVYPDSGLAEGMDFTFGVKWNDPTKCWPQVARVQIIRYNPSTGKWERHEAVPLSQRAHTGIYEVQTRLPPGLYRHKFYFKAQDGTRVRGDPAARYWDGPSVGGPPVLSWCGQPGFESDGVDPDQGPVGGVFTFKVMCQDAWAEALTRHALVVRRGSRTYLTRAMIPGKGSLRWGQVYRTKVRIGHRGTYRYRFAFANRFGQSKDPPAKWQPGPGVDDGSSGLTIAQLSAQPTHAGAELRFTLNQAAAVTVTVHNVAGRPVAAVCRAQECEAGATALLWDARSDAGLPVPSGVYLVEVTARRSDGAEARQITRLPIRR